MDIYLLTSLLPIAPWNRVVNDLRPDHDLLPGLLGASTGSCRASVDQERTVHHLHSTRRRVKHRPTWQLPDPDNQSQDARTKTTEKRKHRVEPSGRVIDVEVTSPQLHIHRGPRGLRSSRVGHQPAKPCASPRFIFATARATDADARCHGSSLSICRP